MSVKHLSRVWESPLPKNPIDRFVLVSLADQANDEQDTCWPSIGFLARRTGLSERTVQRAIRDLEAGGFIAVKMGGRNSVSGTGRSSIYRVLRPSEGVTQSPLRATDSHPSDHSRVTDSHPEGVTQSPSRVSHSHPKGVTQSPEPSGNHQLNHLGASTHARAARDPRPSGLDEVMQYARSASISLTEAEGAKFFDHFEANGWRTGRNPIRDWRAALRNWSRRAAEFGGAAPAAKNSREVPLADCTPTTALRLLN